MIRVQRFASLCKCTRKQDLGTQRIPSPGGHLGRVCKGHHSETFRETVRKMVVSGRVYLRKYYCPWWLLYIISFSVMNDTISHIWNRFRNIPSHNTTVNAAWLELNSVRLFGCDLLLWRVCIAFVAVRFTVHHSIHSFGHAGSLCSFKRYLLMNPCKFLRNCRLNVFSILFC